jgi:hypothetical protein
MALFGISPRAEAEQDQLVARGRRTTRHKRYQSNQENNKLD